MSEPVEIERGAETLGAYRRVPARTAQPLRAPLGTDLFGTELRYFAVIDGAAWTSSSVSALARKLGRVTLHPPALAEALSFGMILRDRTIFEEIRSIPPHSTLHPDGRVTEGPAPHATRELRDGAQAARLMRDALEPLLAAEEARHPLQLVGFTGGKDSRILAALPKRERARWHYVSVSGREDAEHQGSLAYAAQLGLEQVRWFEWTSDFLDGAPGRIQRSAELANGIGAVSDFSLLRTAFEAYRGEVLGLAADDARAALWQGTLADGLFGPTWLAPAATLWEALQPRTAHLAAVLPAATLARFREDEGFYRTNPYDLHEAASATQTGARLPRGASDPRDASWMLRFLTKGRAYVCKSLACLDDVCPTQLNPYLHPSVIELSLRFSHELLAADAVRIGLLDLLGPGLSGPSAFGYRAPRYADSVFRALAAEARACELLPAIVNPALADELRAGRFPGLDQPDANQAQPAPGAAGPSYRTHGHEPSGVVKNLRDYEHLLTYLCFVNQVAASGVEVRSAL